jgi:hypothetical protein
MKKEIDFLNNNIQMERKQHRKRLAEIEVRTILDRSIIRRHYESKYKQLEENLSRKVSEDVRKQQEVLQNECIRLKKELNLQVLNLILNFE